jgi:murein L,D-transpeptidase YafK
VPPGRLNPWSQFHLSFDLGYPNAYDRAHGRTGGYLMVHGNCVSIGCYAMTDPFIEEIYTLVEAALRDGQPYFRVHVFPFRMTEANLERHQESEWFEFWQNLKEGHDWFERTGTPPDVKVQSRKYVFGPSD